MIREAVFQGGPADGHRKTVDADDRGLLPLVVTTHRDCWHGCQPEWQHFWAYERATKPPAEGPVVYVFDGREPVRSAECLANDPDLTPVPRTKSRML